MLGEGCYSLSPIYRYSAETALTIKKLVLCVLRSVRATTLTAAQRFISRSDGSDVCFVALNITAVALLAPPTANHSVNCGRNWNKWQNDCLPLLFPASSSMQNFSALNNDRTSHGSTMNLYQEYRHQSDSEDSYCMYSPQYESVICSARQ